MRTSPTPVPSISRHLVTENSELRTEKNAQYFVLTLMLPDSPIANDLLLEAIFENPEGGDPMVVERAVWDKSQPTVTIISPHFKSNAGGSGGGGANGGCYKVRVNVYDNSGNDRKWLGSHVQFICMKKEM